MSQHAQHGDLIVDLDALYAALNAQPHADDHDQPAALRPFAFDARDAVLNRLFDGDHIVRAAWIIASAPKREQREAFKARGIFIVMINTDEATCAARARTVRPEPWLSHIRDWFTSFTDGAIDATHPLRNTYPK